MAEGVAVSGGSTHLLVSLAKRRELVEMGGEEGAAADVGGEVLGDGPREAEAVICRGAAAELVNDDEGGLLRTKSTQANQVQSNQIKSNQIKSPSNLFGLKSNQINVQNVRPQIKSNQGRKVSTSNQIKSTSRKFGPKSNQIRSNHDLI